MLYEAVNTAAAEMHIHAKKILCIFNESIQKEFSQAFRLVYLSTKLKKMYRYLWLLPINYRLLLLHKSESIHLYFECNLTCSVMQGAGFTIDSFHEQIHKWKCDTLHRNQWLVRTYITFKMLCLTKRIFVNSIFISFWLYFFLCCVLFYFLKRRIPCFELLDFDKRIILLPPTNLCL